MISILDFGAVGDGKTDNTQAIQQALDAAAEVRGTVFVPDGEFLTGQLRMHSYTALQGNVVWGYRDTGGSILQLNDEQADCLLDISHTRGVAISGLCLSGRSSGRSVHGVMLDQDQFDGHGGETTMRIERCRITNFTGHGVYLNRVWCFSIRHCMIAGNGGDGILATWLGRLYSR